jgi:Family of unknown function (DUF6011)
VSPIFEALFVGTTRRPCLRVPSPPDGWVLLRPGKKQPVVVCEMVIERLLAFPHSCEKELPHVEMSVKISASGPRWNRWGCGEGLARSDAALERMVDVMRDFLIDPDAVFARSAGRCCLCQRLLKDEVSRGRGIGPECVQKYAGVCRSALCSTA